MIVAPKGSKAERILNGETDEDRQARQDAVTLLDSLIEKAYDQASCEAGAQALNLFDAEGDIRGPDLERIERAWDALKVLAAELRLDNEVEA